MYPPKFVERTFVTCLIFVVAGCSNLNIKFLEVMSLLDRRDYSQPIDPSKMVYIRTSSQSEVRMRKVGTKKWSSVFTYDPYVRYGKGFFELQPGEYEIEYNSLVYLKDAQAGDDIVFSQQYIIPGQQFATTRLGALATKTVVAEISPGVYTIDAPMVPQYFRETIREPYEDDKISLRLTLWLRGYEGGGAQLANIRETKRYKQDASPRSKIVRRWTICEPCFLAPQR